MLSQYSRAAEAPVPGSQYSIRLSSRSSRLSTASSGPGWSVQDQNFSTIQAARKAGESTRPYPTVCGRVACSLEYPESHSAACSSDAIAARSASVRSSKIAGSGPASGGIRWTPATCARSCCPSRVLTLVPQSLPAAPYRE